MDDGGTDIINYRVTIESGQSSSCHLLLVGCFIIFISSHFNYTKALTLHLEKGDLCDDKWKKREEVKGEVQLLL